ncbi:DNA polymerase III subunit delta [Sphingosinicella sp. BN140058]|uniref:DNA polymerase III subunit delta n=1 Tax=Sphingosinicella sp. BN140058 TaxID=1892855 RepID=UPI00101171A0|nr:DNA polymerase III subunit delta [Sphingosinicella sp. BN140058]QAY76880.1 DNA polymerase III subunit delta [Sphingosinicella sp. BN140058]
MKAAKGQIDRALKAPAEWRFFLLYGPDDAGSRALVRHVKAAAGADAERIELSGAELKADPARLADEAASISLFGGARYIIVEPAGDESLAAVEALLQAPAAGNPVVLIAGALKPSSKLLKLALAEPAALAFASYAPEGQEADRLVAEMAREHGLIVRPDLARRLADACNGNRAVLAQELNKLALFVDADPAQPQPVDHDALDAIGASAEEGDLSRLVDSVSGGKPDQLGAELARLASEGIEGIPLIRAVLRRMSLLAKLRAAVETGSSVDSVMATAGKALFWKEKGSVATQVGRWRSELLAKSVSRLVEAERQAKASGGLGAAAVDEELFAICRQAARLR